jgi:IS4 transposase
MRHQDHIRGGDRTHTDDLFQVFRRLTAQVDWSAIGLRADCTWTAQLLAFAGLLWVWSDEQTLTERFYLARKVIAGLLGEQEQPAASYQAFCKLLRKWTDPLRDLLSAAFRAYQQRAMSEVWRVRGWVVFAVDGSRCSLPRTRANEERYACRTKLSRANQKMRARRKRPRRRNPRAGKANLPQLCLTMLWHVGSGLPWCWRAGSARCSERYQLQQMLGELPDGSLLTADAGFAGYDLWRALLESGQSLLIRVGKNVRLLKKLGYAREFSGLVYLWPDQKAKARQPPLLLRLIVVQAGPRPMYLVTSVLDRRQLSEAAAAAIYRRRWGIELFYRHYKQTFARTKLRSQSPDNVMIELEWSLLGVWAMALNAHEHLMRQGVRPERVSFAGVLRAYRRPLREYRVTPGHDERLGDLLNLAVLDEYERRDKRSRDYPRKKQYPPIRPPKIINATTCQQRQAQTIKITLRLTA